MQKLLILVILPRTGGAETSDGGTLAGDFQLAGGPSVLFDSVYLTLSVEGADNAFEYGGCCECFAHGVLAPFEGDRSHADAKALVQRRARGRMPGVVAGGDAASFLTKAAGERVSSREPEVSGDILSRVEGQSYFSAGLS